MPIVKMTIQEYCRRFPSPYPERQEVSGALGALGITDESWKEKIQEEVNALSGLTPYAPSTESSTFNFFREACNKIEVEVNDETGEIIGLIHVLEPFGGACELPFLAILTALSAGRSAVKQLRYLNLDIKPLLLKVLQRGSALPANVAEGLGKILEDRRQDLTVPPTVDIAVPSLIVMHNPFVPELCHSASLQPFHKALLKGLRDCFYGATLPNLCRGQKIYWAIKADSMSEARALKTTMATQPGFEAFNTAEVICVPDDKGVGSSGFIVVSTGPSPSCDEVPELRA